MTEKDVVDPFRIHEFAHIDDDSGKDSEPSGIEKGSPPVVDDQVLVRLNPFLKSRLIASEPDKFVVRGLIDDFGCHKLSPS